MKWMIIGVIVLVLGVSGLLIVNSSDDESAEESASSSNEEKQTQTASLNSLLASGQSQECTYNYTDDEGNNFVGRAYFDADRLSGDFTNNLASGESLQSNVIRTGDTQYVWEEGSDTGILINTANLTDEDAQDVDETIDPDQDLSLSAKTGQ